MCQWNCCSHNSSAEEEEISADESLLIYCKPVELYNILHRRFLHNPSFLRRCLRYKTKTSRKRRRLRAGIVIFNYRDYHNMIRKTEVTEDFSCPFCLMQCVSFKGLRLHLCSSHDLFNFEFWVTEDYQAVNVAVKLDKFTSENVDNGVKQQQKTFFFCSRPQVRRSRNHDQHVKQNHVQFLELDSLKLASETVSKALLEKDAGGTSTKSISNERDLHNLTHRTECHASDHLSATELIERDGSSSDVPVISIAKPQPSLDPECIKLHSESDPSLPVVLHVAKSRKLTVERRVLLQKRQFYHSHRVQPMDLERVMSDRDSEDEVDDEIADFEDRRMLDDFVDVSKDEKQLMHFWNSFVRKQRVIADGHVSWACEAFSKLHGEQLVASPPLFWCWRLFMIKLWNHGLLDACSMNNCNSILENCCNKVSYAVKGEGEDGGDKSVVVPKGILMTGRGIP